MEEKKEDTLAENAKKADKEIQDVLAKYKLKMVVKMDFPLYRQLPDEVQLALKVLENHKGTHLLEYINLENNNDKH